MIPVKPDAITTLLLMPTYLPFGVATARASFYSLLKGKGRAIDGNGNPYGWETYIDKNFSRIDGQPVMRSGMNSNYSNNVWEIPTIFVVHPKKFFYNSKKKNTDGLPSLREVYDHYEGVCAFCHKSIKFADASREHIHSRSLGGGNNEENIALACKRCNSMAGSAMPKLDVYGNEVIGRIRVRAPFYQLPQGVRARPEWKPYLMGAN